MTRRRDDARAAIAASLDKGQPTFQLAKSPTEAPSVFTKLSTINLVWTPERRQQLADMWIRGETVPAIAATIGTTVAAIYIARSKFKLPTRSGGPGRPPRQIARAKGDRPKKIRRVAFETSRLMEFCSRRELVNQTGHDCWQWPLVIIKELIDNALDACEEAEIAPVLEIRVDTERGVITIADNGPGIPSATVASVINYNVRVSSREAYVSPTRGAQGNALKTILPMGFVLSGQRNETLIKACGVAHRIIFRVDQIRQEPVIIHEKLASQVRSGTRIDVHWPDITLLVDGELHRGILQCIRSNFVQIASDFCWLNPHLTLRVQWNGEHCINHAATNPGWTKWRPSDPTCPHWYDQQRFERYMAAHVAWRQKKGRPQFMVREFLSEFRGLTSTTKQKAILGELGVAHVSLTEFFGSSEYVNHEQIAKLLDAMKRHTKKVPAKQIGVIGKGHFLKLFVADGGDPRTFQYRRKFSVIDGVPRVIEFVFGVHAKGLARDGEAPPRRLISAVNWSAALGNPFRSLGRFGEGAESLLTDLRAHRNDPIIAVLHYACPRVAYLDRGKSAIALD
jgi:hypothetical protein